VLDKEKTMSSLTKVFMQISVLENSKIKKNALPLGQRID
jgi:hypothetical protein